MYCRCSEFWQRYNTSEVFFWFLKNSVEHLLVMGPPEGGQMYEQPVTQSVLLILMLTVMFSVLSDASWKWKSRTQSAGASRRSLESIKEGIKGNYIHLADEDLSLLH